jgi:hypothetical protein
MNAKARRAEIFRSYGARFPMEILTTKMPCLRHSSLDCREFIGFVPLLFEARILLTSAATVQGFNARIYWGNSHHEPACGAMLRAPLRPGRFFIFIFWGKQQVGA